MGYTDSRFELFVDDLDRAIAFYEDVLGLRAHRHPNGYVDLRGGGVTIGLGLLRELPADHHLRRAGPDAPPGIGVELVLEVDDVEAAYERVSGRIGDHEARLEPIVERPWGVRDFRVADPDGYYVRVTEGRRVEEAPPPRTTEQREEDTLGRLRSDVDLWAATADAEGRPHLVPLSFIWQDGRITLATGRTSVTGRNVLATGAMRLALGHPRDVVIVDGEVEVVPADAVAPDVADAYERVGWDPRTEGDNVFIHVMPRRIQAWREVNEMPGREIMRNGEWRG